jgi:hypothetical protein
VGSGYFKALKTIALANVLAGDGAGDDYQERRVVRWYSRTFHTPVAAVEQIPLEDVLLAYYECGYEDMDPDEREKARVRLLESEEERRRRVDEEECQAMSDLEFERQTREAARAQAASGRKTELKPALEERAALPEVDIPKPLEAGERLMPDMNITFADVDSPQT